VISVVVPVYNVQSYLADCLDSLLAQTRRELEIVVVDDGSTDSSRAIADEYAARDPRVRVVHTDNHGLGAARNEGLRHVSGEFLAFADSDDVVPRTAYGVMAGSLVDSGADFATGSIVRWARNARIEERPELLGDVFAWNKLYRRGFWASAQLSWPEGVRYEDQPTTTKAFLAGRFDVLPDIVYHWRIRTDGSSITQQRASMKDLEDRLTTKRDSWQSVSAHGDEAVATVFRDRVLAGDLWRYFELIPGASDEWWALLRSMVLELWGGRSLVHSGLPPVHRLTGWLVEQDRRADAVAVQEYAAAHQVERRDGRIVVPVVDGATVDPAALALRDGER
jgi:glycosyltransferase involved in cell wall biosynthesis